ncbi:carbon-nitrogen hydrolase family protein [Aurantimicrobium minutum]|uniref:carbon-nitrogen hydrolase family protein n=1 Tax=Aurantimicrobium minutum TaxID=708131 RepID=UPI002473C049|nr:carbon-nitrogen hydrolase family protein [Aurantimicrobium minutum]MDH6422883.1 putative amidohydrolase [Aurantimicrobium minutum]
MTEEFNTTNDDLGESQDIGGVKVAVAQFGPGPNPADNITMIQALVHAATENGARLVILPEFSAAFGGALGDWVNTFAETLEGPFVEAMAELADEVNVAIVVGMVEKSTSSDPRPFNTLVAVLPGAGVVAKYRKVHLYDAFGDKESDWIQPGTAADEPETFVVEDITVGMQTCYDLRFPEVTRRIVDAGAHLVAMPSEWIAGPKKAHHWVALTSARAIENMVFVAGADQIPPVAVGMSRIVSPLGETLADMGQNLGVSIATLNVQAVIDARDTNPALELRRYSVHPKD